MGGLILMFNNGLENIPVGFCVPNKGVWAFPGINILKRQNLKSMPKKYFNSKYTSLDQEGKNGEISMTDEYMFVYVPEVSTDVLVKFNQKYIKPYVQCESYREKCPQTIIEILRRTMNLTLKI